MKPTRPVRRATKVRALLVASAGAAAIVFGSCGAVTSGNLIAPPQCNGVDGGPPNCIGGPSDAGDGGP